MDTSQNKFYEGVTRLILKTIDGMGLDTEQRLRAKNLALLFRDSFKSPQIKQATFPEEQPEPPEIADRIYASNGFCRASSIAFIILMGGEENGWRLMAIPEIFEPYGPHHYILHKTSNTILDLTADQFTHYDSLQNIPYQYGKPVFDKNLVKVIAKDSPALFAAALGINLVKEAQKLNTISTQHAKTRTSR